jgi:hypothetical protein
MTTTLWIGIALIAVGTTMAWREHIWLRSAQLAPGKVIELVASSARRKKTYQPRVQYTANDGSTHVFTRGFSSNPPDFSVGESITVAYDARSNEGRILTFGQRYGSATVLTVIGLAATILATTFIIGRHTVPRIYVEQKAKAS